MRDIVGGGALLLLLVLYIILLVTYIRLKKAAEIKLGFIMGVIV